MKAIKFRISILSIVVILFSNISFAQIVFNRLYGGSGSEQSNAIIQTYDDGYAFTGHSYSAGSYDLWLVKLDAFGDTTWTKIYGFDWKEMGYDLIQMPDSGFVIIGTSTSASSGLYDDIWLIRTDKMGDTLWTKFYGELWEMEIATDIINTSDGGFAVTAIDYNDQQRSLVWLMKFNANGDTTWTKKYGNILDSKGVSCVIQTSDNGYLMGGSINITSSISTNDYYLIKTDSVGDTIWTKSYGYRNSDGVTGIAPTNDGGYYVAGFRDHYYNGFSYDVWMLKINVNGDSLWSKYHGGYSDEYPKSIHPTNDGGYIVGVSFHGQTWDEDGMMLLKLYANADTMWTYKYKGNRNDWCTDAKPTSDGGYVLCGYTDSDSAQIRDAWIIKTDDQGRWTSIRYDNQSIPLQFKLNQNYPNPFNPFTKISYNLPNTGFIKLTIYDVLGREIFTILKQNQTAGIHTIIFDGSSFTSGIYFYKLNFNNEFSETKKMILLK